MQSDTDDLYSTYVSWKRWDQAAIVGDESEQFATEISRAGLPNGARILDIGFGRGDFLDWGRQRGFQMSGVEIIPSLVSAAKSRGHVAYLGSLREISGDLADQFDCVVMFDVLEHLPMSDIMDHLRQIHDLLRPGGALIARVPNAASFAGLVVQHGDVTHVTSLSISSFQQLSLMTGFQVEYSGNAARSYAGGRRSGKLLHKRIAYFARNLIENFVGYLFFGTRIPLDPNITVVLRRMLRTFGDQPADGRPADQA